MSLKMRDKRTHLKWTKEETEGENQLLTLIITQLLFVLINTFQFSVL